MSEPQPALSLSRVLKVVIPVALILGAAYWWSKQLEPAARDEMAENVLNRMLGEKSPLESATMLLTDKDSDMVADRPEDPAKLIAPDVLVFSYVASESEEDAATANETVWKELLDALSKRIGKEVKFVHYKNVDEQLAAMQKGELHVAGLNTGIVPAAVIRDGFVPLCTFGRPDGTYGYTMEFIVPADSAIKDIDGIRGHKVTFVRPDSNSGFKAPLMLLKQKGMQPERDYEWGFSLGHEESIKGVAVKTFEVAPIASDILARMQEKNEVDPAAYKSIFKSDPYPPATIGIVYNLTPELSDAIRDTLVNFSWAGTGLEKEFGPETTKFVAVDYKKDWESTREIDKALADARKKK